MVLLVICMGAPAAFADYKAEFRAGVAAKQKKNWNEVVDRMTAAIAEKGEESSDRIVISGNWFEKYVPHYYLALAHAALGNCDAALNQLRVSEGFGVANTDREYSKDFTRIRTGCPGTEVTPPPPPPPPGPVEAKPDPALLEAVRTTESAIDSARKARQKIDGLAASAEMAPLWSSVLRDAQRRAGQSLDRAIADSERGKNASDLATVRSAGDFAKRASDEYASLERQALKARDEARSAASSRADEQARQLEAERLRREAEERDLGDAKADIRRQITRAQQLIRDVRPNPAAAAIQRDLEQLVRNAQTALGSADLRAVRSVRDSMNPALAKAEMDILRLPAVNEAPGSRPRVLTAAAGAFVDGRYADALAMLESAAFTDPKQEAHARLLRAASRFAVWAAQGAGDDAMLQKSVEDIRRCKTLNAGVKVTSETFAPPFVVLFEKTR